PSLNPEPHFRRAVTARPMACPEFLLCSQERSFRPKHTENGTDSVRPDTAGTRMTVSTIGFDTIELTFDRAAKPPNVGTTGTVLLPRRPERRLAEAIGHARCGASPFG